MSDAEPTEPVESAESVESAERGEPAEQPEADAWATACEEDLAAEKARRREEFGPEPVSAAEELRRLADAVSARVAELGKPLGGAVASGAAQGAAQQLIAQARAVVEPVVERHPQFFDHLAAAGGELLAAYRSAVQDAERRWTTSGSSGAPSEPSERITLDKDPDGNHGTYGTGGTCGTGEAPADGDDADADGGPHGSGS